MFLICCSSIKICPGASLCQCHCYIQGCLKTIISRLWGGGVNQGQLGKNIKLCTGEYHGCGEEHNVEKRERRSNIIFPKILRLLPLGRISRGEGGQDGHFWEENKAFKKWGGEEYQVLGNFIHPCTFMFIHLYCLSGLLH